MDKSYYISKVLDGMNEFIGIFDKDTNFIYANKPYLQTIETTFGIGPIKIGNNYLKMIEHIPTEHKKLEGLFGLCLSGKSLVKVEKFGSGEMEQSFELSGYPLKNVTGEIIGVSTIIRNVTERENLKEKALKALKVKETFLTSISHELRTPLNSILGFSQLASLDLNCNSTKSYMTSIMRSGKHLLGLVNNILDLNKINSGVFSISKEVVNVYGALKEVYDDNIVLSNSKNLNVILDVKNSLQMLNIIVDKQRFKQIIIKFLSNAMKYNKPYGSVIITMEKVTRDTCDKIYIYIKDTGIGISEKNLTKIGQPFDRFGQEASNIEGTGLGLSITKKICDIIGGEFYVDSVIGEGSTFGVGFEISDREVSNTLRKEYVLHINNEFKGTIGYIEDNNFNLHLIEKVITKYFPNATYTSEKTGDVGFEMVRKLRPDVLLLDINIPKITGLEILKKIKNDGTLNKIKIIIITADVSERTKIQSEKLGCDKYLSKPIDILEMIESINLLIG